MSAAASAEGMRHERTAHPFTSGLQEPTKPCARVVTDLYGGLNMTLDKANSRAIMSRIALYLWHG